MLWVENIIDYCKPIPVDIIDVMDCNFRLDISERIGISISNPFHPIFLNPLEFKLLELCRDCREVNWNINFELEDLGISMKPLAKTLRPLGFTKNKYRPGTSRLETPADSRSFAAAEYYPC